MALGDVADADLATQKAAEAAAHMTRKTCADGEMAIERSEPMYDHGKERVCPCFRNDGETKPENRGKGRVRQGTDALRVPWMRAGILRAAGIGHQIEGKGPSGCARSAALQGISKRA